MPTKIEYCQNTWNPITGCSANLISDGCKHCYAKRIVETRFSQNPSVHYSKIGFRPCVKEEAILHPQVPKKGVVFIGDMADMFGLLEFYSEGVIIRYGGVITIGSGFRQSCGEVEPLTFETAKWAVETVLKFVKSRPQQQFLILTKRPKALMQLDVSLPNLWVGVSICNQEEVWKLRTLNECNAMNRWLSIEPMLSSITFDRDELSKVNWVVCGGERTLKHEARPMQSEWATDLMVECQFLDIPFFFKQTGSAAGNDFEDKVLAEFYRFRKWRELLAMKQLPVELQPPRLLESGSLF